MMTAMMTKSRGGPRKETHGDVGGPALVLNWAQGFSLAIADSGLCDARVGLTENIAAG